MNELLLKQISLIVALAVVGALDFTFFWYCRTWVRWFYVAGGIFLALLLLVVG